MKRTGSGQGFSVMKKGHEEKTLKNTMTAGTQYSKYGDDNERELAESVDKLAGFVKANRMKY